MKIFTVMIKTQDDELNAWDVLNGDDLAFMTKELAQQYINSKTFKENYFITELELIGA